MKEGEGGWISEEMQNRMERGFFVDWDVGRTSIEAFPRRVAQHIGQVWISGNVRLLTSFVNLCFQATRHAGHMVF
jgi:hypothetical protein